MYFFLAPNSAEEKSQVTYRFLQRKIKEYVNIKIEIEKLRKEAFQED